MDEDAFNMAVRKFLKEVGVTSQREIERLVREGQASKPALRLKMTLTSDDGGLTPYLHVRADLWAKVTRALYYDLVDMGEERVVDGQPMFGIESGGEFFAMADAQQVRDAV